MINSAWMSLYDYLRKPAGSTGIDVYKAFKREYPKDEPRKREIDMKTYKGSVMLYPKDFLDRYYGKK